jgi:hypothetical protein
MARTSAAAKVRAIPSVFICVNPVQPYWLLLTGRVQVPTMGAFPFAHLA